MQEREAKTRTAAASFPSTPAKHRDEAEMREQPAASYQPRNVAFPRASSTPAVIALTSARPANEPRCLDGRRHD